VTAIALRRRTLQLLLRHLALGGSAAGMSFPLGKGMQEETPLARACCYECALELGRWKLTATARESDEHGGGGGSSRATTPSANTACIHATRRERYGRREVGMTAETTLEEVEEAARW